jgi:hypothetical protein
MPADCAVKIGREKTVPHLAGCGDKGWNCGFDTLSTDRADKTSRVGWVKSEADGGGNCKVPHSRFHYEPGPVGSLAEKARTESLSRTRPLVVA